MLLLLNLSARKVGYFFLVGFFSAVKNRRGIRIRAHPPHPQIKVYLLPDFLYHHLPMKKGKRKKKEEEAVGMENSNRRKKNIDYSSEEENLANDV